MGNISVSMSDSIVTTVPGLVVVNNMGSLVGIVGSISRSITWLLVLGATLGLV